MKRYFDETTRMALLVLTASSCVGVQWACARLPREHAKVALQACRTSVNARRLELNTASSEELESLPGIGKQLADRIVEFRNAHGRFRRAEHLMMVRGISERKFRQLQPLIAVD